MRFSFTIERLSVHDMGIVLALHVRAMSQAWDAGDMAQLIDLVDRRWTARWTTCRSPSSSRV